MYNLALVGGKAAWPQVAAAVLGLALGFVAVAAAAWPLLRHAQACALAAVALLVPLLFAEQLLAFAHWRFRYFLAAWALGCGLWLWALYRRKMPVQALTRYFNLALGALLAYQVLLLALNASGGPPSIFQDQGRAIASRQPPKPTRPLPDVYLILLDGYPGAQVLQERFGYRNQAFTDSLQSLGLWVAQNPRSNYTSTILSMPSMLGLDYLPPQHLAPQLMGPLGLYAVRYNRTVRLLHGHGYTLENLSAFRIEDQIPPDEIRYSWGGASFYEFLVLRSIAHRLLGTPTANTEPDREWQLARHKLAQLHSLVASTRPNIGPRLVYLHLFAAHHPVDADRNGRVESTADYPLQIRQFNGQVLAALRHLLAAPRPALVLLLSDHGPRPINFPDVPLQTADAYQNFCAVYFPDRDYRALYPGITPVNLMRAALNKAVGTRFAPLPDAQY